MTPVVIALAVLGAGGSPGDLGVVLTAHLVPHLLLLLVGGVVADRCSRRTLLVVTNLGSALTQAAMAAVLLGGGFRLPVVAALSVAAGALDAMSVPALRGIVPELVAPERLQRVNSVLASTRNATRIVGPAVGGVLVATVGGGWALAVDAGSYLLAAACYTRLAGRASGASATFLTDLRHGWAEFTSRRWVVVMAGSFALVNAANVGPWNILGPGIVGVPASWGVILSARAVGLLAMSVLLYRITLRRPLRTGSLAGAVAAAPLLALGADGPAWLVGVAAFVGALGLSLSGIAWETTLQQQVSVDRLSRVASNDDLLSYLSIPLSQLLVGPLAAAFGASTVALAAGFLYLIAALSPLLSREVRTLAS